MRVRLLPALAALVLGAATAVLVACGGDGRIPAGDASSLKNALNQVSADYRAGQCTAAAQAVAKAQNELLNLPDSVNAKLRDRLQSGISNLRKRVYATCEQTQTATTTTDTGTTGTGTGTTDTGTTGTGTTGTGTTATNTTTAPTDTGTGGTSVGGTTP